MLTVLRVLLIHHNKCIQFAEQIYAWDGEWNTATLWCLLILGSFGASLSHIWVSSVFMLKPVLAHIPATLLLEMGIYLFSQGIEKLKANSMPQWIFGSRWGKTTTWPVGLHTTSMVVTNSKAPVALQHIKPRQRCRSCAAGSNPGAASQWRNDWVRTEMTGLFIL